VADIGDVQRLREIEKCGIYGVIIGRALYTGKISLEAAIKAGKTS
jgi:phosphoribosylformimino-5-aminoimidazole carboxamide ribonucleotide (ProFAR) isomerase